MAERCVCATRTRHLFVEPARRQKQTCFVSSCLRAARVCRRLQIATAGAQAALVAERVERQHPNSQCCAPFCLSQKSQKLSQKLGQKLSQKLSQKLALQKKSQKLPRAFLKVSQLCSLVGQERRCARVRCGRRRGPRSARLSCGRTAAAGSPSRMSSERSTTSTAAPCAPNLLFPLSLCPPTAKVVEEPGLWGAGAAHARRACGIPRSTRRPARRAVPQGRQPPVPPLGRPNHSTGWSQRPSAAVEESQGGQGLTARDAALRAAERPRHGELPRLKPCPASRASSCSAESGEPLSLRCY